MARTFGITLSDLQFNILLWPAQEVQSEQAVGTAYFSAARLREKRKNELEAFTKAQLFLAVLPYVTENVVRAYDDIDELIKSAGRGQEQARKAWKAHANVARRELRDALILHCRSQAEPGGRGAFLAAAEKAFGRELDREP